MLPFQVERLTPELILTTARAGGPGGQHVNKVETKVTLKWDVANSRLITADEKELLLQKLHTRMSSDGVLVLTAQESRSQSENRERVLEKLKELLVKAFHKPKARKATKATKTSRQKRLQSKKAHSEKKKWRQRPAS